MKILITGGGGFLGFKLAKTLLARGQLGGKADQRASPCSMAHFLRVLKICRR